MKKIPLSQGEFALVDAADFEWLSHWKWHLLRQGKNKYAMRKEHFGYKNGKRIRRTVRMHIEINKTPKGMKTDHRDGNGLNNQRHNLRDATQSQNQMNRGSTINSTSKYKGVCWKKDKNRWLATIMVNYKQKYLGVFKSEIIAAAAYNVAAKKYHGEFAKLNIIGEIK